MDIKIDVDEISLDLLIEKLDSHLLSEITKLAATSEQLSTEEILKTKIELSIDQLGKIIFYLKKGQKSQGDKRKFKNQLGEISNILNKVYQTYRLPSRQDKKLRRVAKILGLTTGKRQEVYDKETILWEYLELREGQVDVDTLKIDPPMERREAIALLMKKHGIQSENAFIKLLGRQIKSKKDKLRAEGLSDEGWQGLLPGREN